MTKLIVFRGQEETPVVVDPASTGTLLAFNMSSVPGGGGGGGTGGDAGDLDPPPVPATLPFPMGEWRVHGGTDNTGTAVYAGEGAGVPFAGFSAYLSLADVGYFKVPGSEFALATDSIAFTDSSSFIPDGGEYSSPLNVIKILWETVPDMPSVLDIDADFSVAYTGAGTLSYTKVGPSLVVVVSTTSGAGTPLGPTWDNKTINSVLALDMSSYWDAASDYPLPSSPFTNADTPFHMSLHVTGALDELVSDAVASYVSAFSAYGLTINPQVLGIGVGFSIPIRASDEHVVTYNDISVVY